MPAGYDGWTNPVSGSYNPGFVRYVPILLLVGASCGGGAPEPRPVPHPPTADAPKPPEHTVVAWLDGRPITRDALLDGTLAMDYKGTVDRYVMRVLVDERKKTLGIVNTPEQLRGRAEARVRTLKAASPAVFEQNLRRAGITEAEFVDRWAADASLDLLLGNEKAAVYELFSGGYARVDIAVLNSIDEADAYQNDPKSVTPREVIGNLRISRTIHPTLLRDELIEEILAAGPEQRHVRAGILGGAGAVHVTIHETQPPRAPTWDDVVQDVLRAPPDSHELEMWLQRLFRDAEVKYDDRWYSPGN